ncbi:ABA4-like family protein [Leptospira sp. 2 VSF19]|uniref:ABA4-like family protein n=1 Tax=Leptospira soteropolitanensis TaxID=2950025 RepID=A0AAW5V8I7_9LEPT|nr:ABA4-like family protein [Leptospira soteropolitanensis]MCW7491155.1 ABA4-like family protein [Leptospira soteropolitanensis]MCW7498739.1 ABA4-like family protein [Leptospira soteropolitanensis]MCW7521668.1 ABA4-like family protein [Leptospira soteropolitanensis]MCW7524843.1 ABA4-like family protein [Leptospira soteropolitanensis]MCW7528710.1 ABA4-like family protein [Leptospira soteropolitanensis]
MNPSLIFKIANGITVLSWLVLIFSPNQSKVIRPLRVFVSGLLLGGVYVFSIFIGNGQAEGNFSSLDSVRLLFANDYFLLAGWIHYLAFDLFLGTWETEDGIKEGINRWILVPILALTFYFGPAGWLLYLVLRFIHQKITKR